MFYITYEELTLLTTAAVLIIIPFPQKFYITYEELTPFCLSSFAAAIQNRTFYITYEELTQLPTDIFVVFYLKFYITYEELTHY